MKCLERLLLLAAALAAGGVSYLISSVFGLLKWPVFLLLCLFSGEIVYRIDKLICAHGIGNQS